MKRTILFFYLVIWVTGVSHLFAQTSESQNLDLFSDSSYTFYQIDTTTYFGYQRPGAFQHFSNCFVDVYDYSIFTFSKENLPTLAWVTTSTTILLVLDQILVDEAQRFGDRIGLAGTNNLKKIGNIFGYPIQVPTDLPSGLYFIGDGWTDTALMATFLTYGLIDDNVRSLQTASQLAEGILATTIVTQFLKHITGRETPLRASEPRGKWRPFPNQIKYHKKVPKYDAFPSGHLAAGIATLEIIAENYKEYKFIRPVGYTLLTVLCYQMLNNGVHWASDYPLAMAMGYAISEMILKRNRKVIDTDGETSVLDHIKLGAGVGSRNQLALILSYNF